MTRRLLPSCLVTCVVFVLCGGAAVDASTDPIDGVTTGFAHGCALTSSGGVRCWGRNDLGQLGRGTVRSSAYPNPGAGLLAFAAPLVPVLGAPSLVVLGVALIRVGLRRVARGPWRVEGSSRGSRSNPVPGGTS